MTPARAGWRGLLHQIEDLVLAVALGILVLLAAAQIGLRLAFDAGFLWLEPLLRTLVMWVALLGAMAAAREGRHISLDAIQRLLPSGAVRVVRFIAFWAAAIATAILAWHALRMVRDEYGIGTTAFASVPAWLTQSILPLALAVIALRLAITAFQPPPPPGDLGAHP